MITRVTFEGTVTRVYDEQRGQYTNTYVVVTDGHDKYPNILRFGVKPGATAQCAVGDAVKVNAYLNGREWTNQQGQVMYFTDLKIDTVEVLNRSAAPSASVPTTATDWKSLVALGAANGENEVAVKARCEAYKAKVNRRFTPEDYAAIANEILSAHATPGNTTTDSFEDDCPF